MTDLITVAEQLAPKLDCDAELLISFRCSPWLHYSERRKAKRDGTPRRISEPCRDLKRVQRRLLGTLLRELEEHEAGHCRRSRSVRTHLERHRGHRYRATFDIQRCFPSVTPQMVRRALLRGGVPSHLAGFVAGLCTYRGELPQGAPTSMALLNAVLAPLDVVLTREAARHGLVYSRFVDDLAVSGNRPFSFFERIIDAELSRIGFRLAREKTRYSSADRPTLMTGLRVGRVIEARPDYLRDVFRMVGEIGSAAEPMRSAMISSVRGHVAHLVGLQPSEAKRLERRLREVTA